MKRQFILWCAVGVMAMLSQTLTQTVTADLFRFDVTIDAAQEVPAPTLGGATPAGMATVFLNSNTGDISIDGTYSGLTSATTGAHLHGAAAAGLTAGVFFALTRTGNAASGTISGTSTLSAARTQNALDGLTYINIHTNTNGSGEIRGQLTNPVAVPEPGSLAIASLASLGLLIRRRKR